MSPAVLHDFKPPRRSRPENLGFFRGAVYTLLIAAWIVAVVLVLTTSI